MPHTICRASFRNTVNGGRGIWGWCANCLGGEQGTCLYGRRLVTKMKLVKIRVCSLKSCVKISRPWVKKLDAESLNPGSIVYIIYWPQVERMCFFQPRVESVQIEIQMSYDHVTILRLYVCVHLCYVVMFWSTNCWSEMNNHCGQDNSYCTDYSYVLTDVTTIVCE